MALYMFGMQMEHLHVVQDVMSCYAACTPCTPCTHTHSVGCICRHDMLCTCILYHSVCYAACTHTHVYHTLCITHVSLVMYHILWHARWILSHVSQHVHNMQGDMHSVGTSRDIQMSCRMVTHLYTLWMPEYMSAQCHTRTMSWNLDVIPLYTCCTHTCTL